MNPDGQVDEVLVADFGRLKRLLTLIAHRDVKE